MTEFFWRQFYIALRRDIHTLMVNRFGLLMSVVFYLVFIFYNLWYLELWQKQELVMAESLQVIPWLLSVFVPLVMVQYWRQTQNRGEHLAFSGALQPALAAVAARYLVHCIFLSFVIGVCWSFFAALSALGHVDLRVILTSYLGMCLLAAFYLSLSLALSVFVKDSAREYCLAVAVLSFLTLLTPKQLMLFLQDGAMPLTEILLRFSPMRFSYAMSHGYVVWGDVCFFVGCCLGLLLLKVWAEDQFRHGWRRI